MLLLKLSGLKSTVIAALFFVGIASELHADPVTSGTEGNLSVAKKPLTPEQKAELRARFLAKYDLNKDGKLDNDEKAKIRMERKRQPKEWIFQWDLNHDGKLDKREIARIPRNSGTSFTPPYGLKSTESSVTPQLTGSNQQP